MNHKRLILEFVEFVPDELDAGHLYVSMEHAVAVHLCACGCGRKTVTPLSPVDWRLIYDGRSVSLRPSIGNWSYPCRSHYWITDSVIEWADDMTEEEIKAMRGRAQHAKKSFHKGQQDLNSLAPAHAEERAPGGRESAKSWTKKMRQFLGWSNDKS